MIEYTKNIDAIFSTLINDDIKTISKDDFVYHYTDADALKCIIENNSIHLTNRKYVNDKLENKYFSNLLSKIEKDYQSIFKQNMITADSFFKNDIAYVFSLSKENDSIHQWSFYAKYGYALEFKLSDILNFFYKYHRFIENGTVIYEKDTQSKLIKRVFSMIENKTEDPLYDNMLELEHSLSLFSLLFKQSNHSCENEYRIIASSDTCPQFKVKNGIFVPYLEINGENDLPINSIRISPYVETDIAIDGLRHYLRTKNRRIEIIESDIKMRY